MIIHRADCAIANNSGTLPLEYLLTFARHHELHVTSGEYIDGDGRAHVPHEGHVPGSLHYAGRAIDVSLDGLLDASINHVFGQALALGINVVDERVNPNDGTPWTGSHAHLSISPPGTGLV